MGETNKKIVKASSGFGNDRASEDFYATDPNAVKPLVSYLDLENIEELIILEPCCGNGNISNSIPKKHKILSYDLIDRGFGDGVLDFLLDSSLEKIGDVDLVIINPPYNLSTEFLKNSLKVTEKRKGKVCFLNKLNWLSGVKRKSLFLDTPFSHLMIFSKEPKFYKNGTELVKSCLIEFAWFIWDWDRKEGVKPTISWV